MARKEYSEDETVSTPRSASMQADGEDISANGAEILELEPEQESPFLRAQKRVPVRRGPLPRKAADRLKRVLAALTITAGAAAIALAVYAYGRSSWRFRLDSSDHIQITGNRTVSRAKVLEVFGGDISRNVFSIPLAERKRQLEQVPWIESATVMRLLPNSIRVDIHERTPVAYVRLETQVKLIDRNGVVMEAKPGAAYSFPVVVGVSEAEPLSTRAARMKLYQDLLRELDSEGAANSRDVSEVDVSDLNDARITVADPQGDVVLHLGASGFLDRYRIYLAHVAEWRQQYRKIDSVDLRYGGQVIVSPDAAAARAQAEQPATEASVAPAQETLAPAQPATSAPKRPKPPTVRHRRHKPKITN